MINDCIMQRIEKQRLLRDSRIEWESPVSESIIELRDTTTDTPTAERYDAMDYRYLTASFSWGIVSGYLRNHCDMV
jgi:hypothetical protein